MQALAFNNKKKAKKSAVTELHEQFKLFICLEKGGDENYIKNNKQVCVADYAKFAYYLLRLSKFLLN